MKIVLIRHPPTTIAPGLCYGRLDLDLRADAGAAGLRARVAAWPGRVWTSPARRCRAIAGPAAIIDARLLELDFGAWEGLAWADIPRADLDRWAADPAGFAPPGGESGAALLSRVEAFHAMLRDRAEDALVVAHGGPLKLLAALLRGAVPDLLAPAPQLGSVSEINC
jgi:alpha-ribazole phosphatase